MYDIVEHRCAFLALCSGVTTQIWPSSMREVDWCTHHAVPVLSFLLDAAKSCGTCASEFPDLNHLGFWLFDVLLSTCTLQQGIQLQSPKVVGQQQKPKGRWSLYRVADTHIPTCMWHLMGCVQCVHAWVLLSGQGCVLGPLGKITGHKLPEQLIQTTAPFLGQANGSQGRGYRFEWMFSWTGSCLLDTCEAHRYNSLLQKQILLGEVTVRNQNL